MYSIKKEGGDEMYIPNIRYIKGAPKSYPLLDAITPDAERRVKEYHSYLVENG